MELVELHILQRKVVAEHQSVAVPAKGGRVAGDLPDPAVTPGGKHRRLAVKDVQLAGGDLGRDRAPHLPFHHDQVQNVELVEKGDLVLDALLVEGLQDHVPGAIGRVAGAPDRLLGLVVGMPAERPLGDLALRRAIKREPHVLQLNDRLNRFVAEDLHRVLVRQVVGAFDRVVCMPLGAILFEVSQGRADTTLSRPGVGAEGVELADDGRIDFLGSVQRGHQARPASTDDHRVETMCLHSLFPGRPYKIQNRDHTRPSFSKAVSWSKAISPTTPATTSTVPRICIPVCAALLRSGS